MLNLEITIIEVLCYPTGHCGYMDLKVSGTTADSAYLRDRNRERPSRQQLAEYRQIVQTRHQMICIGLIKSGEVGD
jgi:hypothetical protein